LPKRDSPDRDMLLAVVSFSPIFVAICDRAMFSRTDRKVMLLKEVLKVLDISQY
jgi:hypothetical protein